jgi:hypothetical protein
VYNEDMANYNFEQDLPIAIQTEREIADILRTVYKAVILDYGHTNAYDIRAKVNDKIFTFEVKEDFTCERTGNVGVEFECRGKPSGISVSKANFYIYKIHSKRGVKVFLYKTSQLKAMIANEYYFRVVNGGDVGSGSMNYLFTYDTFTRYGKQISPR